MLHELTKIANTMHLSREETRIPKGCQIFGPPCRPICVEFCWYRV